MTPSIAMYQTAAKLIESDGDEGFWSCAKLAGFPVAVSLLIAHLREAFGATNTFPADPKIDEQVVNHLKKKIPEVMHYLESPHATFYMSPHYALDNFSSFAVLYRNRLWMTSEHAYQAAKFDDEAVVNLIFEAKSAHDAKQIARAHNYLKRGDWDTVKEAVMEEILYLKAVQHECVRKTLKRSLGLLLIEDSPYDGFWGRGPFWDGKNKLGYLWMKVGTRLQVEGLL